MDIEAIEVEGVDSSISSRVSMLTDACIEALVPDSPGHAGSMIVGMFIAEI